MNTTGKVIAWVCIFSSMLIGCYTSVTVYPDERHRILQSSIESVLTKDGTKYLFDKPPTVVSDSIKGDAKVRVSEGMMRVKAAIPWAAVKEVVVRENFEFSTTTEELASTFVWAIFMTLFSWATGII